MNDEILINFHSMDNFIFYICNLYDTLVLVYLSLNQGFYLWAEKLEYLKKIPIRPKKLFDPQLMHKSLEKLKRSSCQHYLISIWSQLQLLLAAPGPLYVVYRLNSGQRLPRKNDGAAADARTCPLSRKRNCLNPFSKKPVKGNHSIRPKSIAPMNRLSAKRSRHQRFIGCWPVTDGARHVSGVQKIKIESHHGLFKQTESTNQSKSGLVYALPKPAGVRCCRSYLCAFGGHF